MKKLLALASAITALLTPVSAFAQIKIEKPKLDNKYIGYSDLGSFITNITTVAFILAIILVLIMLVWGAFEWIASGGDKEAVGKARNRIINAIIGLAVLAIAFALAKVGAQIVGIDIFSNIIIPPPPSPLP